jgi:uncharacterized membrane-anchored protein
MGELAAGGLVHVPVTQAGESTPVLETPTASPPIQPRGLGLPRFELTRESAFTRVAPPVARVEPEHPRLALRLPQMPGLVLQPVGAPPIAAPAPAPVYVPVPAPMPVPAADPEVAAPAVAEGFLVTSKLPQITALFWALKMAATTVGETGGDQISEAMRVGFVGCFLIFLVVFLVAVTAQVRAGRFIPALYWTVIVATSAMGTELADFIFHTLGIGFVSIVLGLLAPMAIIYLLGRFTGGSFSVTDIKSRRDEALYWALILTSNTIGTGVGDGMAVTPLGVWGSTILIAALMGGLYWLYRTTSTSRVALFWAAFILTRPLGATGGDLLWKPAAEGGLGLGRVAVSFVLVSIIVALAAYQTRLLRRRTT